MSTNPFDDEGRHLLRPGTVPAAGGRRRATSRRTGARPRADR